MLMEIVPYKGWETCYRLANEKVDLIVTGEVGPRVIRFGFLDAPNEFCEYEEWLGRSGDAEWHNYGGHRLWHAPEQQPRTYAPDNDPITVEEGANTTRFIQSVEATTGIQKEMDIAIDPVEAHVTVTHRLRNTNLWTVELAPWALSVMAQGGKAIVPMPPRGSHRDNLLPNGNITLWAYTDLVDPRWTWGTRFAMLRQDPSAKTPQKAGFWVNQGWVAYARAGHLFVKIFESDPSAPYPDRGVNVETFTNQRMLEVETMGPLTQLAPGATVEHVEQWYLFDNILMPENTADIQKQILYLILPHLK